MALEHHVDHCGALSEGEKDAGMKCKTCEISPEEIEGWDESHRFSTIAEQFPANKSASEIAKGLGWTVSEPSEGMNYI